MTETTTAMADVQDADICVIGAGPAGLSVVAQLLDSGVRVVMLESGGVSHGRPDAATEDLGVVEEGPVRYIGGRLDETRGRQVGGTAGRWSFRLGEPDETGKKAPRAARYAPLDEIDMEPRPGAGAGWPMPRADLDRWYARAHELAALGPVDYDAPGWQTSDRQMVRVDPDRVQSGVYHFGPASAFEVDLRDRVWSDPSVQVHVRCTVVGLGVDQSGQRVETVRALRPDGTELIVRAGAVVVATGAIEAARLLLAQEQVRGGLGNAHDQVGRCFMEHPLVRGGFLVPEPTKDLAARLSFYDLQHQRGSWVLGRHFLAPQLLRQEGLLNMSTLLLPRQRLALSPAVLAWDRLRNPAANLSPARRLMLASRAVVGAPDVLRRRRLRELQPGLDRCGWSRGSDEPTYECLEMVHQTEQLPDPANRVTLGQTRDENGQRRPVLTWAWGERERRSVQRGRDIFAAAFEAAGLGRLVTADGGENVPHLLGDSHHHLGTTRMSTDPRAGVVDSDCRVHGMANLYIAGGGVFPTGGYVNPTLTIIALAARLGHHLGLTTRYRSVTASPGGPG